MHINVYSQPSTWHKFADLPVQLVVHGQLISRQSVDLDVTPLQVLLVHWVHMLCELWGHKEHMFQDSHRTQSFSRSEACVSAGFPTKSAVST